MSTEIKKSLINFSYPKDSIKENEFLKGDIITPNFSHECVFKGLNYKFVQYIENGIMLIIDGFKDPFYSKSFTLLQRETAIPQKEKELALIPADTFDCLSLHEQKEFVAKLCHAMKDDTLFLMACNIILIAEMKGLFENVRFNEPERPLFNNQELPI